MREILFRGQRTDNHQWVEGFFIMDDLENPNPYIVNRWKHRVSHKTIGQYTGLTDKNGKKVFEGDILSIAKTMDGWGKYYVPPLEYPVNVIVKWDFCAWMWETLCADKRYITFPEAWCHYECEVIGNIHDNPELLEESNES